MQTFIVDVDDTQTPCELHYSVRTSQFCQIMYEEFRRVAPTKVPTPQILCKWFEAENTRLIEEFKGFHKEIFPRALVNIYRRLADQADLSVYSKRIEDKVYALGMSVFDQENYRNTVLPGVRETLEFLVSKGDELIVYTKGPDDVQAMKLEVNNLRKYFSQVYITHDKNHDQLRNIVGNRDRDCVHKVGNSIPSDINPALEVGIRAVYIPAATWSHEDGKLKTALMRHPKQVRTVCEFSAIREIYGELCLPLSSASIEESTYEKTSSEAASTKLMDPA